MRKSLVKTFWQFFSQIYIFDVLPGLKMDVPVSQTLLRLSQD